MKGKALRASDFLLAIAFIMCLIEFTIPSSFASTMRNRGIIGPIPTGGYFPTFNLQRFLAALNDPVVLLLPIVVLAGITLRFLATQVEPSRIQRFLRRIGISYF